jgi:hypothetical protein
MRDDGHSEAAYIDAIDVAFLNLPGDDAIASPTIGNDTDPAWTDGIAGANLKKLAFDLVSHAVLPNANSLSKLTAARSSEPPFYSDKQHKSVLVQAPIDRPNRSSSALLFCFLEAARLVAMAGSGQNARCRDPPCDVRFCPAN